MRKGIIVIGLFLMIVLSLGCVSEITTEAPENTSAPTIQSPNISIIESNNQRSLLQVSDFEYIFIANQTPHAQMFIKKYPNASIEVNKTTRFVYYLMEKWPGAINTPYVILWVKIDVNTNETTHISLECMRGNRLLDSSDLDWMSHIIRDNYCLEWYENFARDECLMTSDYNTLVSKGSELCPQPTIPDPIYTGTPLVYYIEVEEHLDVESQPPTTTTAPTTTAPSTTTPAPTTTAPSTTTPTTTPEPATAPTTIRPSECGSGYCGNDSNVVITLSKLKYQKGEEIKAEFIPLKSDLLLTTRYYNYYLDMYYFENKNWKTLDISDSLNPKPSYYNYRGGRYCEDGKLIYRPTLSIPPERPTPFDNKIDFAWNQEYKFETTSICEGLNATELVTKKAPSGNYKLVFSYTTKSAEKSLEIEFEILN